MTPSRSLIYLVHEDSRTVIRISHGGGIMDLPLTPGQLLNLVGDGAAIITTHYTLVKKDPLA